MLPSCPLLPQAGPRHRTPPTLPRGRRADARGGRLAGRREQGPPQLEPICSTRGSAQLELIEGLQALEARLGFGCRAASQLSTSI